MSRRFPSTSTQHTPSLSPQTDALYAAEAYWRARDRYRALSTLRALLLLPFLFMGGMSLLLGEWRWACAWLLGPWVISRCARWLWRQGTRAVLGWWAGVGLVMLLSLSTSGCALWFQHTHPPIRQTVTVPEAPGPAYARAVIVAISMGGTLWQQDPQSRTLQAFLGNGAARLDVIVQARGKGSEVVAVHQNLPTYFAKGDDGQWSSQFLALYTQHAARK